MVTIEFREKIRHIRRVIVGPTERELRKDSA